MSSVLKDHGFTQCPDDIAVFVLTRDNQTAGILALHVDDVLGAGNEFFRNVLDRIKKVLHVGKEASGSFTHTGIRFVQSVDGITIDQEHFIAAIPALDPISHASPALTTNEYNAFRKQLGALMWVASSTRPDIAVSVSKLSTVANHPGPVHYNQIEKLRRYLMSTIQEKLVFRKLPGQLSVLAFSDASFQNLSDAGSQGGFLVSITSDPSHLLDMRAPDHDYQATPSVLISWKSARIKRVVRSTFAGELLQCSSTFDNSAHIRDLYDQISGHTGHVTPLTIMTDCMDVIDHLRSLKNTCSEKRLNKEVHLLRETVATGEVTSWIHVPSTLMQADGLTKEGPKLRALVIAAMRGKSVYVPRSKVNHKSVTP